MLGKEKKRTTFRELLKIRNHEVTISIGLDFFLQINAHLHFQNPSYIEANPYPSHFFLYCSVDKQVFIHQLVQVQSPGIGNDDRLWLNLRSIFLRLLIYQESKISFVFSLIQIFQSFNITIGIMLSLKIYHCLFHLLN